MIDAGEFELLLIGFKKKFKNIFATTIGHRIFVWKLLTRKELDIIRKSSSYDELLEQEMICQQCVLFPVVDFSRYKAGIPTMLAPQILEASGFGTTTKTYYFLNKQRESILSSFTKQAEIAIASAFPQYKFEDMENWDVETLLEMVAKAEWKLNTIDNKDFLFEEVEQEEEEEKLSIKESLSKLAEDIVENGGDPIFVLGETYKSLKHKPYIESPFILGTNFDSEGDINAVMERIQQCKAIR